MAMAGGAAAEQLNEGALLLTNIGQLVTLRGAKRPRRGHELGDLQLIEDAAVLCTGGKFTTVGRAKDALKDPWLKKNKKNVTEIDCEGRVVLPGFVDSHTHPVFTAPRLVDFEKRIAGASYEEIAAEAGGGIRASLAGVRAAKVQELAEVVLAAWHDMAAHGTTTVEAKSGYGLSTESELKSLEAIQTAASQWPGTVVASLLGAHVCAPEFKAKPEKYLHEITHKMIPAVAKKKLGAFVDVFCDRGAFTLADTEAIFEAAQKAGLGVRAHVCQLTTTELWPLLRFNPASFDHMDCVADEDLPQLAKRDVVATLLPAANHFLAVGYPPARKLIDTGVAVALATDYNPGTAPTTNMPFVLSLACTQMKMSPAEAIAAATINGAWALRLAAQKGSVEPGKDADLAVFDVRDYREVPYWLAAEKSMLTIAGGEVTFARDDRL